MPLSQPKLSKIVDALPAWTPFVAPEELERRTGRPVRVRLGANESLFGPSPRAAEAIRAAALEANLYGDPEGVDLREAIAVQHGVSTRHLVLGAGIDELQGILVRTFLDPGEVSVQSHGSYPTWAYHIAGHGGRMVTVPYRNFRNDLDALLNAARQHHAKLLYIANPDNPTGSHVSGADQEALLKQLPPNCLLVLDEAYAPFAAPDMLPDIDPDHPGVIRLRTFSKAHGLAGMRVGYALGSPELVRPFDRIRNHFGVSRPAQAAALAALADQAFTSDVVAAVAEGREDYSRLAAELGLEALPSATNFVAIDMGDALRAKNVLEALLEREGVFIRMPGVAPLNRCIRVTVGRPEDRAYFAEAFRRVVRAIG